MWVEVGAALAATEGHPGECILEDLLEAEELDDPEVDRRVEAEAALVRAERAVELHSEATVDVDLACVVLPRDSEDDLTLRFTDALDDLAIEILRVLRRNGPERTQDFVHALMEFELCRISLEDVGVDGLELLIDHS